MLQPLSIKATSILAKSAACVRLASLMFRVMHISTSDMLALRILQPDSHPSLMGIGGKKEGFSLLALLDRCVTTMVRENCV
jgi:hypothetical protein